MRASIGWRFPLCTAIVLLAHCALVSIVVDRLATAAVARTPPSRLPVRLVVLAPAPAPDQVAATEPVARPAAPARVSDAARVPAPTAAPTAAPAPAQTPKPLGTEAVEGFVSPRELDVVARPRSAPDTTSLQGLPWSGVPMRLRLFIAASGTVVDAVVLQASDDEEVVQRVRRMFLATAFVAGRAQGVDVASYKDVEIAVGSPGRENRQVACAEPGCGPSR